MARTGAVSDTQRARRARWIHRQDHPGGVGETIPRAIIEVLRQPLDGDHGAPRVFAEHDEQLGLNLIDGPHRFGDRLEVCAGDHPGDDLRVPEGSAVEPRRPAQPD